MTTIHQHIGGNHSQRQKRSSSSNSVPRTHNRLRCKIETHMMKVLEEETDTITVADGEKMVLSILTHSTIGGVLSITDSSGQSVIDGGGQNITEIAIFKKKGGRHSHSHSQGKELTSNHCTCIPHEEMELPRESTTTANDEMKEDSFVVPNITEKPVQYDIQLLKPDSYEIKITSKATYQAEVFLLVKTIWREDNHNRRLQKEGQEGTIISEVKVRAEKKEDECKRNEGRVVAFSLGAGYIPFENDDTINFTFIGRHEI